MHHNNSSKNDILKDTNAYIQNEDATITIKLCSAECQSIEYSNRAQKSSSKKRKKANLRAKKIDQVIIVAKKRTRLFNPEDTYKR